MDVICNSGPLLDFKLNAVTKFALFFKECRPKMSLPSDAKLDHISLVDIYLLVCQDGTCELNTLLIRMEQPPCLRSHFAESRRQRKTKTCQNFGLSFANSYLYPASTLPTIIRQLAREVLSITIRRNPLFMIM
jgi:hypothetical protein